jgi:uncharacterized protein (DUF924 family)
MLRDRFTGLLDQATAAELYTWRDSARGRLAEIIVLDQFSRNIYRDSPKAFAQDPMAVALTQEAVTSGALEALSESERTFLLMPMMHSESRLIHQRAEILFDKYCPKGNADYERKHKAIIDRFGRYPHRNEILGRESTQEEIDFLKQPGSSF